MQVRKTLLAATIAALPLMMMEVAVAGPMMAGPAMAKADSASIISSLMSQRGKNGLGNEHGYAMGKQHPGVDGTTVSRVDHTFKGLRVHGSESVVVSGARGDIMSESKADRRAGLSKNMDLAPAFASDKAIAKVVAKVAPAGKPIDPPSAELLIYPVMKEVRAAGAQNKAEAELNAVDVEEVVDHYELAYLVKTRMANGNKPVFHDTVINAKTGAVIDQWSMLQTVVGTGNSQYNGAVPINTTLTGTTYSMKDPSRGVGGTYGGMAITNANHGTTAGSIYTNTTNTWGDGQQYIAGGSTTNANGQTAAVNAMWGLMNTYDTLSNTLGWKSLNGANTATYIAVHVNTAYDNAYYSDSCKCMFIGDGGSYFNNLGSIDVIGHEMGHGVTAATSNLAYRGESGGLNESASDIMGEAVEAYARNGGTGTVIPNTLNDWMMGQEIAKNGQPLRWMYKPSKDGSSPDAWKSSLKRLDVHYSSGPNNRMFYFLSQGSSGVVGSEKYSAYLTNGAMTGIGTDKAYRIWFKALTTKFTSSTNYADARTKMIASATELYGAGSAEVKAVTRAYAAINVGLDIAP
jgi:Zn-dependent metalloprotease